MISVRWFWFRTLTLTFQTIIVLFGAEHRCQSSWKLDLYHTRNHNERGNKRTNQPTNKHVWSQYLLVEVRHTVALMMLQQNSWQNYTFIIVVSLVDYLPSIPTSLSPYIHIFIFIISHLMTLSKELRSWPLPGNALPSECRPRAP